MENSLYSIEKKLPRDLPELLLAWYDKERRILPWREDPTPYHVWVSEIMLQQTRVETVLPYYERFMRELPDTAALAEAEEDRLLKLWEGLGYYSRIRNMQKAARQIMELPGSEMPSDPAMLVKLSGIGSYTAAAIASIAFQVPAVALDGNLMRVYARLSSFSGDIRTSAAKKEAELAYLELLPKDRPGDMNQALMDLGATVCLPNGAPLCGNCPLGTICSARRAGRELEIPAPAKQKERTIRKCTVLLIRNEDMILIHRRPEKGLLAGLYEFPNADGILKENEVRELAGSYGLSVKEIRPLGDAKHVFTHLVWEMTGYEVRISDGIRNEIEARYGQCTRKGDELPSRASCEMKIPENSCFVPVRKLRNEIALPSAFSAYAGLLNQDTT